MMGTGAYGSMDAIIAIGNVFIPIVSLGISNAIIRFGLEKGVNKRSLYTNGLLSLLLGFFILLVLTPLSPLFLPSGEECLYIACEQDAGQTERCGFRYIRRGDDYLRVFREMPGREAGSCSGTASCAAPSRTSPIGMCNHGKTIGPKSARSCSWTTSVSKTHPLRTWKPRSTAWTAAITARSS